MKLRDTHTPGDRWCQGGGSARRRHISSRRSCTCVRLARPRENGDDPTPLIDIWDSRDRPHAERSAGLEVRRHHRGDEPPHPAIYLGTRRTMERRIREWRGRYGPEQEVIFRQTHEPGRMGLSDFTDYWPIWRSPSPESRWITRLYHFRMVYSGFEHAHVVLGGRELHGLGRRASERTLGIGRCPGPTSQRQLIGGLS